MIQIRFALLAISLLSAPAALYAADDASMQRNPVRNTEQPNAQAPSSTLQRLTRPVPTPEESRAALMVPVSTQPSLGGGPAPPIPSAEAPQHQGAGAQMESKNTIGGPQGTGANVNHPQSGQQSVGEKPTTATTGASGVGSQPASSASPNAVSTANNEPPPSGPIGSVGETIPSTMSKRNDVLDRTPIMGFPMRLSDEQRKQIYTAMMDEKAQPAAGAEDLSITRILTTDQALNGLHPLPQSLSSIAQIQRFKYIKAKDKAFLVEPATRIVVDEFKG